MLRKVQPAPVAPVKGNRFAALESYDTDSGSESDSTYESPPTQEEKPKDVVKPVAPVVPIDDSFTLVGGGRKGNKKIVTDANGWSTKSKVQWNRPRFIDSDSESETEIKKELELEAREVEIPDEDEDLPPVIPPESAEGFGSLLNRGKSASLWADKIKESLDKAESVRKNSGTGAAPGIKPTEDFVAGLGNISFFSKGFGPRA